MDVSGAARGSLDIYNTSMRERPNDAAEEDLRELKEAAMIEMRDIHRPGTTRTNVFRNTEKTTTTTCKWLSRLLTRMLL